ncbi:MAG: cellulase family glycosylhydrolase [Phycisphaerae bacterium]|nr:cellulase family glycosylhydrolase [Phycisphaerae bacterium]
MNTRCLISFITALLIFYLPGLVVCKDATSTPARTDRIQLWENGSWYLLGVNYPWLNYAHDFGATAWGHDGVSADASKTQVDADFAFLKSQGVHVVRWFLFGDCRAAPEFDPNGTVMGFDEHFYSDVDAAIAIAQKHGIYLIPVLLDFHLADGAKNDNGVQLGGRSALITNRRVRQSFLDNALKPLFERYGRNRNIIAWDVMNEPEGAMDISGGKWVAGPVSAEAMPSFVKEVVDCIHAHSSQHVTLGSASRQWLSYWKNSKLDFYQYHYYDRMEAQFPLDYRCANLKLDKPCIIGEFPTKNTKRTMTQYLDTIWNNGYAGALAWSYRASDEVSHFRSGADEFVAWARAHSPAAEIGPQGRLSLAEGKRE